MENTGKYGINIGGHGPIEVERVDLEGTWNRNRFETIEEARAFVAKTTYELSDWKIFDAETGEIFERMKTEGMQ